MRLLKDVVAELVGMFMGDARLTSAILALVALAAVLIHVVGADPLYGGGLLLAGCLVILAENVHRFSRRR